MKQFKLLLAALLVAVFGLSASAQEDIWVNGYVFNEKDNVQTMIPFATVKFYNDKACKNLAYFYTCGPFGNYNIKPYNYKKDYYIVVEAPGYKTRQLHITPISETYNGKKFTGNATVHVRLEPDGTNKPCASKVITGKEIPAKMSNVKKYLLSLDGINYDSDGWFSNDDRGILLCLNGMPMDSKQLSILSEIPVNGVKNITIYDTDDRSPYGKAIDITLIIGKPATAPNYTLGESALID